MDTCTIDVATDAAKIEAVRSLCRAFVGWQVDSFPQLREAILTYFEPTQWEATLAALPEIHARPKGAMLLATVCDEPAGCIMYREMAPGVAEVKRLFVIPSARGRGIGQALVSDMLARAAKDGYRHVRLDTARFLTAAIAVYRKAGFRECAAPRGAPHGADDVAIFMERRL